MRTRARGFSMVEVLVVVVVVGLLMAIVIPRFRVSQTTKARQAADQLVRDLEAARSRAIATRSLTRVVISALSSSYTGYLDSDRNGVLAESAAETSALESFRSRALEADVRIGRGTAADLPGYAGAGSVTLPNSRVEFDSRGLTTPLGTSGVIYLQSVTDPSVITAVSVSGAAAIRSWVYRGGVWQ
jgi:prepilin-type N-terminal cleavage/methylation domain-containing protein